MKNLLKKKVFAMPIVIIFYFILLFTISKLTGTLTFILGIGGSIYLYTKNTKFKSKHIIIKIITGIALFFGILIFGTMGLTYNPEQARSASNQVANEQQIEQGAEESATVVEDSNTEENSSVEENSNEAETTPADTSTGVTGELKVHFINVGQADSILLQQGSSTMLIDGGNNSDGQSVKSYIDNQGITKLDYVVGTHAHEDHIGGLDYVINAFQIGKVYFPKQTSSTTTFNNFVDAVKNKGLQFTPPTVGESFKLGNATCTILAPNGSSYEDVNDYSIVIKIQFGDTSYLFEGDAETISETEMLNKGLNLNADVLKVGHHGSNSSTSANFLSTVSPKYAVISVGKDNSYGHPTQSTMDRLKAANIQVYRTDENGTIVSTSNGKDITFSTQPGSYNGKASSSTTTNSNSNASSSTTSTPSTSSTTTNEPAQGNRTVYWTPNGKSYHYDKNCQTLSRSKTILEGPASSCPKTDPCDICAK